MEFIKKYPDLPWKWSCILSGTTLEFIKKYEQKPWYKRLLSFFLIQ